MIASLILSAASVALPQEPVPPDGLSQLRPGARPLQGDPEVPVPSEERALYPWLAVDPAGRVSANWMQPSTDADTTLLWAQRRDDGSWSEPEAIAAGDDWFVNWADHPMHAVDDQGHVLATWLKKVPGSTYSYHVMTRQRDAEGQWSDPRRLHEDDSATEHGFVSIAAVKGGGFVVAWLDGRATAQEKPMQLRARRVLTDGSFGPELLVDARVCDCCGTTLSADSEGSFRLAYRDRTEEEVRDLGLTRLELGADGRLIRASEEAPADGWVMPGCPVNGPASTSWQGEAAVVWFTAHPDPRVRLVRGDTDTIVRSERGVMGRVSCSVVGEQLAVSWLETRRDRTSWWVQWFQLKEGRPRPATAARPITDVSGARADGFLRLAPTAEGVLAMWIEAKPQRLCSVLLKPGG